MSFPDRPEPLRRMVIHIGAPSAGAPGWRRDIPYAGTLRAAQDDADRCAASYGSPDVFIVDVSVSPERWWRRPAGGAWEEMHD